MDTLMFWGLHGMGLWTAIPTAGVGLLFNLAAHLFARKPCAPCGGTGFRDVVIHR